MMRPARVLRRAGRTVRVGVAGFVAVGLAIGGCSSGSEPTAGSPDSSSTTHRRRPARTTSTTSTTTTTTTTSSSTTVAPGPPAPSPSPSTTPPPPDTCGARSGPIFAALQGGDLSPVPLGDYAITECRIAASNPIWAAVTLAPLPGKTAPQLTVALLRIGSIWTVKEYAPNHVACDAPAPVPAELRLGC